MPKNLPLSITIRIDRGVKHYECEETGVAYVSAEILDYLLLEPQA